MSVPSLRRTRSDRPRHADLRPAGSARGSRVPALLLALAALLGAGTAGFPTVRASENPPAAGTPLPGLTAAVTNEPPLVLFLEAGGRTFPVSVDQPLPAEALQAGAPPVLRLAPHREFRVLGLSFRYPREFAFEFESGEDGFVTWTFTGRDAAIILNWFPGEPHHRSLRKRMVKEFEETVKEEDEEARPKRSSVRLEIPGGRLDGDRIAFDSFGVRMDQACFSFRGGDGSFVLTLQDSEDGDGLPSAERGRLERWLRESLTLPPVQEPTRRPAQPERTEDGAARAAATPSPGPGRG